MVRRKMFISANDRFYGKFVNAYKSCCRSLCAVFLGVTLTGPAQSQTASDSLQICTIVSEKRDRFHIIEEFLRIGSHQTEGTCDLNVSQANEFLGLMVSVWQVLHVDAPRDPLVPAMAAVLLLNEGCYLDALHFSKLAANIIYSSEYDCPDLLSISSVLNFIDYEAVVLLADEYPRMSFFEGSRYSSLQPEQIAVTSIEQATQVLVSGM